VLGVAPAAAHKPSDAYLRLSLDDGGQHQGAIDVALRDLEMAIGIDGDGDGAITWGELKARHRAIDAWLASRLSFSSRGASCPLRPGEHLVDHHTDGAYAVVRFTVACPDGRRGLTVRYTLLFDLDPMHRGLLTTEHDGAVATTVLSPDRPTAVVGGAAASGAAFPAYFILGGEHLLFGLDHLLFLLVLLLPPAFRPPRGAWHPVALDLAKILSAFTVAHGLSLAAAVTGLVDLPSRLVESLIALTIVLAAIDNLRPWLPGPRAAVVFVFGLIHGLGFASALDPLDLPAATLALALLGFNLGIEAAQLMVALAFLGASAALHRLALCPPYALQAGSLAALAVAGAWFVERAVI
jgi:hypothetical protein